MKYIKFFGVLWEFIFCRRNVDATILIIFMLKKRNSFHFKMETLVVYLNIKKIKIKSNDKNVIYLFTV